MTCARISLATCAILLACAARRVKRIACVRYSSCVSRFIVCRVACCALSCWLCCAVLWYGDALRWLCGAVCCAWSCGYLSLFVLLCVALRGVVLCGGGGAAVVLSCLLVYCLRRQLCASCSATCCYCPTAFTGCRLSSCRIPSVAVPRSLVSAAPRSLCVSSDTYHYSHFHNYLLISVTYNLSDNGIYPMQ